VGGVPKRACDNLDEDLAEVSLNYIKTNVQFGSLSDGSTKVRSERWEAKVELHAGKQFKGEEREVRCNSKSRTKERWGRTQLLIQCS